jgi:hypothetical protein
MSSRVVWVLVCVGLISLVLVADVRAGELDPPGPPQATASYSLSDLYLRMTTGAAGTQVVFTEPLAGPGTPTMFSVEEIMSVAPELDDAAGAVSANVLTSKTYWCLTSGQWGLQTGSMPENPGAAIMPTTTPVTIPAGYHDGTGTVVGDADLDATNIRSGTDLFGVVGNLQGCFGSGSQGSNCSSTCGCQSGLVCVDVRGDLTPSSFRDCIAGLTPPPHFPVRYRACRDWINVTNYISNDGECIDVLQDGLNPYEYIIPTH